MAQGLALVIRNPKQAHLRVREWALVDDNRRFRYAPKPFSKEQSSLEIQPVFFAQRPQWALEAVCAVQISEEFCNAERAEVSRR